MEASDSSQAPAPQAGTDPQELVDQFKKDELKAAAEVQGVDVPSKATKADIAEAIVTQQQSAPGRQVTHLNRRSDNDPILGSWVDVVSGPHQGRRGHYCDDIGFGQDGYPETVLVRSRDADNLLLPVAYSDIRPSAYTGGR